VESRPLSGLHRFLDPGADISMTGTTSRCLYRHGPLLGYEHNGVPKAAPKAAK
jgi:hypothetical protein